MRAEEARVVADFLVSTIKNEIPITTSVFAAVPADKLNYSPDSLSKTALGLLRHLTLEDEWMLNSIADGRFEPPPDDSDACGIMTPQDAIARYTARMAEAIGRIQSMSGDALLKEVDLLGMVQLPAVEILSLMVRHTAHHRGQLSAYIRAMGGKMPMIYGPTAEMSGASEPSRAGTAAG